MFSKVERSQCRERKIYSMLMLIVTSFPCDSAALLETDWENAKTRRFASYSLTFLSNRLLTPLLSLCCLCFFTFIPRKSLWTMGLLSVLTYIPACLSADTHSLPSVILCVCVCVWKGKCGRADVFMLFCHLKRSAEPRPSYHIPIQSPCQ